MNTTPIRILGVAEIVLSVRDIPPMRSFYENVLGFELHGESSHEHDGPADPEGEPTISFLKIADSSTPLGKNKHPVLLALIDYRRHIFAKPRFEGHEVRLSTLNHLAFEIPESTFDEQYQRLIKLQLAPTISEFPNMSAKAIFFKDPEGNVLELIAHDSAASAFRQ